MKTIITQLRLLGLITMAHFCLWQAVGADAPPAAALEKGFKLLKSAGAAAAFDAWREGGLLEDAARAMNEANKFKELVKPLRDYRSYELIEVKEIGKTSKILYVAMSFERGVLYGKFLLCESDRGWIVQRMDFDTRPEVIMPWLDLAGSK